MASSISSLPLQAQGQGDPGSNQAAPAAAGSSTSSPSPGSIGPFFAIISVLTFLAVVSCVVGRICIRRGTKAAAMAVTPLDTIKHGGWLGWLKLKCGSCMAGEIVAVSAKVVSFGDDKNNDTHPHAPQV